MWSNSFLLLYCSPLSLIDMLHANRSIHFLLTAAIIGAGVLAAGWAYADESSSSSSTASSSASADTAASSSSALPAWTGEQKSGTGLNILPGKGTIVIEQKNGSGAGTLGSWTMIQPDNKQRAGTGALNLLEGISAGKYTIFAHLPDGSSATMRIYRNDVSEQVLQKQQASLTLNDGDRLRIVISYTITKSGLVAVDSDPLGMTFTMKGPNNTNFSGTTPTSFFGLAEGQYQVFYDSIKGCNIPTSKSLRLEAGSRVSFTVYISCPMADKMRERQTEQGSSDKSYTTVGTGNNAIIMRDVPQDSWFAPFIATSAKYGILSGYTDKDGNATGEFGPGNNVNVAELAKAAHKIAGISTDSVARINPINTKAQGQWFSPFITSAEKLGWTIYSDATIDPTKPATRGEVLVTLLQALDIRLNWQKGNVFTDVSARTPFAGAIETAAAAKVVEGRKDANGNDLKLFGPADAINRAEFAKILSNMIEVFKTEGASSSSSSKR